MIGNYQALLLRVAASTRRDNTGGRAFAFKGPATISGQAGKRLAMGPTPIWVHTRSLAARIRFSKTLEYDEASSSQESDSLAQGTAPSLGNIRLARAYLEFDPEFH
jgi:hypothetical protein